MKIAIHNRPGSNSDVWIKHCKSNNIPYKIVNCYDSNIIEQLTDCDGLMWHWHHNDYRAQNFARQLIISVENMGKKVFPDSNNCWHYDDKVGQKYLLEAFGAPLVSTYVFYDKEKALKWLENTTFPKIFKLRGGAGSYNVKLVNNKVYARKLVNRAFKNGFPLVDKNTGLKERLWVLRRDRNIAAIIHLLKGLVMRFYPQRDILLLPRQLGYVYFQEFIDNLDYDIRLVVIKDKAFGIKRTVRKNDFRASGSGFKNYNPESIDIEFLKVGFEMSEKLNLNCIAIDLVKKGKLVLIIEISYAFVSSEFPGYWDKSLVWHNKKVNVAKLMIKNFVSEVYSSHKKNPINKT